MKSWELVVSVTFIVGLFLLLTFTVTQCNDFNDKCVAKGGMPLRTQGSAVCMPPGTFIPMDD